MAETMGIFMTQKGWELLAKKQIGVNDTEFTRMAVGSGNDYEGMSKAEIRAAIKNSDKLLREEVSFPFSDIDVVNGTTVCVTGILTNKSEKYELDRGFFATQVGVYANDPDEGEILYNVMQFKVDKGVSADYIPAFNGKGVSTFTYSVYTDVADADKVEITINSSAYLNADVFHEYKQRAKEALEKHVNNRDIHLTVKEKESLAVHVENDTIHVTPEEKEQIKNNSSRIDSLYDSLSADFSLHIDFVTLDMVDLESGHWNQKQQRVEC